MYFCKSLRIEKIHSMKVVLDFFSILSDYDYKKCGFSIYFSTDDRGNEGMCFLSWNYHEMKRRAMGYFYLLYSVFC